MDTYFFKDWFGILRPADREYYCVSGDYVRRPDGKLYRVSLIEGEIIKLCSVNQADVPEGANIVDLVPIN